MKKEKIGSRITLGEYERIIEAEKSRLDASRQITESMNKILDATIDALKSLLKNNK